ncbi:PilZ domain-containing protein [Oceanobacter mangrovi]|uniref:PilZ domain-containing protein n=1 Tax=Oceanobacter mangrovi TaxID=2862510 RepID=UPI001C8DBE0B|nr:PilZ domain-containing protein [Oceanobacter mangrovi]
MNDRERRFAPRYDAAPLQVELQCRRLLGGWQAPHRAIGIDIARGGLAILSPLKLKSGSRVRLSLGNRHLRLHQVPARILRQTSRGSDFIYGISFELDDLPASARQSADEILAQLLQPLTHLLAKPPAEQVA